MISLIHTIIGSPIIKLSTMKRFVYILLWACVISACIDDGHRRDSSSLAGSVEVFESYMCSVSFVIGGSECAVLENRVYIEKISKNRVKISIGGCFDPQRPYNIQTTVDLTGVPGDVKFDGDYSLSLLDKDEEVFDGSAKVSGFIINHGVKAGSGTDLAVQDLEADIRFEFEGDHKYDIRCFDIVGPYPDEF